MALLHSCYYPAWLKSVHLGEESLQEAQKRVWVVEVEHRSPGADATGGKRCASKEVADGRSQTNISKRGAGPGNEGEISRAWSSGRLCNSSSSTSAVILRSTLPRNSMSTLPTPSSKSLVKIPTTTRPRVKPFDTDSQLSSDPLTTVRFPNSCIPKVLDLLFSFSRCVKIV